MAVSGELLVSGSVREFVAGVASVAAPVPAGGSVAALTGATSAALLALVCGVQLRKQPGGNAAEASGVAAEASGVAAELLQAQRLQRELLALVDEDAAAFRGYLDAKRAQRHGEHVDQLHAVSRSSQTPLQIAAACAAVVELSARVEAHTTGPTLGDVHAARHLASAALASSLAIAEQNVSLLDADQPAQTQLRRDIARLRDR